MHHKHMHHEQAAEVVQGSILLFGVYSQTQHRGRNRHRAQHMHVVAPVPERGVITHSVGLQRMAVTATCENKGAVLGYMLLIDTH